MNYHGKKYLTIENIENYYTSVSGILPTEIKDKLRITLG